MAEGLLLDTYAWLWLTHDDPLSPESLETIEAATQESAIFASAITAWEAALLVRKERYRLRPTPAAWFASLLERPGVNLVDLSPDILIESVFLPGEPPNDPADRMIAATARTHSLTVVTRDQSLRAYAAKGWVSVIVC